MIEPLLAGEAFLADVRAAEKDPTSLHAWWLGQSGFLLSFAGRRALLDPYLSDSLTRKYAATSTPHVRMTRRVVDPARLPALDVVTSTHAHTDHLDPETLAPIFSAHPTTALVIPEATRELAAERAGIDRERPFGLDPGEHVEIAGVRIEAVPAAHETIEYDDRGHCRFLGYVIHIGDWCVYHSGDTIRHEGMSQMIEPNAVDVAFLPINGRDPARGVAGNLTGVEAAHLARDVGAACAVPCHYEMFEFNTASPDAFVATAHAIGQRVRVLQAGERMTFSRVDA